MPRVSVILPTYNRRDVILETIRSSLDQTYRDLELIVIDDGSGDETAVEILRHLGPDPARAEQLWRQHAANASGACGFGFWTQNIPLQYIYQTNRGMGAARNRGLQLAQGDLVAFLEPEYLWDSNYLVRQVEYFDRESEAMITHGKIVMGRQAARNGKKRRPTGLCTYAFEDVVAGNDLAISAMVIRRACVLSHGCFDENLPSCEDYDLWVRIAAHVPIHQVPESVVHAKKVPPPPSWSLDRYRVYALEKAFQSGHLNADQRHRVAEEMVARCDNLVEGYRTRNNLERSNFYDRKRKKFELEVAKLDLSGQAEVIPSSRGATDRFVEGDLSPTGRY